MLTAILLAAAEPDNASFWMPKRASTMAAGVDHLFDFVLWLSVFFFVLITLMLVVFIIKYRHREDGVPHEPAAGHSTALELTWTIIPTVLVLVIFYFGFRGFLNMTVEPPNAMEVAVSARMWNWSFTYDGKYGSMDGKLHIPVNTPVRFVLDSADVIHSLFMPVFRVKKDVVPGRYNRFWVQATEVGEYDIYCAEYCGQNHSTMLSKVVVHTPEDFARWYEQNKDWTPRMPPLEAGQMLYNSKGCSTCHSVNGQAGTGPTWKDMYGSQVPIVGIGNVTADENYIHESILAPQAKIHQGFGPVMPSFVGQLNDVDINAIIWFMKSVSVHYKGSFDEGKRLIKKSTTNPTATQPAGSVPRQDVNTRIPGPPVDPNTQNKNRN
jgi:cytochrome c oxidase subunit 2